MKKVAILQSNYIPWKGYFDLIAAVDEFIIYDDVQYTRQDWRNRNQIKTPQGVQWITVPVRGKFGQTVSETMIEGSSWAKLHWKTLVQNYQRAPWFEEVSAWLKPIYEAPAEHLSQVNRNLLEAICRYLGIATVFTNSSDYARTEGKSERLADLCAQAGATQYVSGPAAKSYLDVACFEAKGIAVRWFDYEGYPEYPQLWGNFVHTVSILDLLFNCGREARQYMRHVGA